MYKTIFQVAGPGTPPADAAVNNPAPSCCFRAGSALTQQGKT